MKTIQVHRHRDNVAIGLPTGETVYLTQMQLTDLILALKAVNNDIGMREFSGSNFVPVTINLDK